MAIHQDNYGERNEKESRTIAPGLHAVDIASGNFVFVQEEMKVSVGDQVILRNGRTYMVKGFTTLGFMEIERVGKE